MKQLRDKSETRRYRASDPRTQNIYARITGQIIEAIKTGPGKHQMPWHRQPGDGSPVNAKTGNEYNGINVLSLWEAGDRRCYASNIWATYRQWQEMGAQVIRGEKGSPIVFYKEIEKADNREQSDQSDQKRTGKIARTSWVFNADQVNNYSPPGMPERNLVEIIDNVENVIAATGADIRHGGNRAYFAVVEDYIQMPTMKLFKDTNDATATEGFYATLFHEMTHWSGHEKRLKRELSDDRKTDEYALEELVAELGAAFLCAKLSVTNQPRPNHAAYIGDWLVGLSNDDRILFNAAAKASKAVEYIVGMGEKKQIIFSEYLGSIIK